MFRTIAATIAAILALGVAGPASAEGASCQGASQPCAPQPCGSASTCPPPLPLPPTCGAASVPCVGASEVAAPIAVKTASKMKSKRHHWGKRHRNLKAQRQIGALNG